MIENVNYRSAHLSELGRLTIQNRGLTVIIGRILEYKASLDVTLWLKVLSIYFGFLKSIIVDKE